MPPEEPWTIGRLLAWTAEFFKKKGSDSPRLDAEVMLAHVLGYERVQLYTHYEDVVGERARGEYRDLVRRRSEGTPVAYLVGRKEFYSLRFDVTPAVLIPRPETEFVVMEFLAAVKEIEGPTAIDVGTGSGCIAVAAIAASADALDVARRNAARHAVADRIEFLEGDLLAPLAGRPAVDVIVSNPPYIATAEVEALDPGVRDFEPRLALDGGVDGLDAYRRIAAQAPPLLKSGGRLILEIGFSQDAEVAAIIESTPGLRFSATVRDLQGHPRVVLATRE